MFLGCLPNLSKWKFFVFPLFFFLGGRGYKWEDDEKERISAEIKKNRYGFQLLSWSTKFGSIWIFPVNIIIDKKLKPRQSALSVLNSGCQSFTHTQKNTTHGNPKEKI